MLALTSCLAAPSLVRAQSETPADAQAKRSTSVAPVEVTARRRDDTPAKLDHILPEVAGTKITVTKKTTVTKLDQQPTVVDNNLQQLFARSPGILVSQQQTPTQFNLSYRGLGNPQESEYVLVLQDGLPISTDWIGFPTLYYLPLIQGVSEIQEIRGGSSLLYGPEPAPALNFVMKRPKPGGPLTGYTEQVGGSDGLYSTYNVLQGSVGDFAFRANLGFVHSDGERRNAQSQVREGDFFLDYWPDASQRWGLDIHLYDAISGDPGKLGYAQFVTDPAYSPTPDNEDWVTRYSLVLSHDRDFAGTWRFEGKLWAAYEDLHSRAAANDVSPGVPPTTTTLQDELFRGEGADLRLRDRWGHGNAFTIGVELYGDDAPFRQWSSTDLTAPRGAESDDPVLRQGRHSNYEAVFAENVFRLPWRIHIVPSVRLEHEEVEVDETVRPPFLSRPLIDVNANREIPLFGIGIGNDFGNQNETYFSVSQGWRPLRFFDVASPFSNVGAGDVAAPAKSLDFEAGVHGTPIKGLFYDAGLFWIDFDNQIETIVISDLDSIEENSGNTRNRGFEGEISYDFLAGRPGGVHLTPFLNLQLLDARFTASELPGQVGKVPAFAPHVLAKYGVTWRADGRYSVSLTGVSVSPQFFQNSDLPSGTGAAYVPARVPGYTVLDVAADWYLTRSVRVLGGVENIGNEKYYSRVFQNGIEPALGRTFHVGLALGF
ncbi:MAG: TonB-dependent receptor family protein [Caulobacteraceae bacterium]